MSRPRSAIPTAAAAAVLVLASISGCHASEHPRPQTPERAAGSGQETTAEPPAGSTADPEVSAAATAVRERFAALERGDLRGWLTGLDGRATPTSGVDAATQRGIFDRMQAMRVVDLRVTSAERAPGSPGRLVRVAATYRLAGFDTAPRAVAIDVGVETGGPPQSPLGSHPASPSASPPGSAPRADASTRLTSWHPADRPQPWDLDGLRVGRTDDALVLAVGSPSRLAELQRRARVASTQVAAVWGRSRPAVWVAPATDADARRLLGRPADSGDGLAAVTDGPLAAGTPAGADRIVVLPTAWDALTGTGRDVVLTHELTHVTVRASTTRPVPDWLSEGFAELVAYRSVRLPEAVVVAPALTTARRDGPARALPADADFAPGTGSVDTAYGLSLLAARTLADRHGLAELVRFYRSAAGGLPVPTAAVGDPEAVADLALREVLGTDRATFVRQWRGRVEQLLR